MQCGLVILGDWLSTKILVSVVNVYCAEFASTSSKLKQLLIFKGAVSTLYTIQSKYFINLVYNSENGSLIIYCFLENKNEKNLK